MEQQTIFKANLVSKELQRTGTNFAEIISNATSNEATVILSE